MLSSLAGAIGQSFEYLRTGPDTTRSEVFEQAPQPQRYNSAVNNMAYLTVVGKLANVEMGILPSLRVPLVDAARGMVESHLGFPLDANLFCCNGSGFAIRRRAEGESEDEAPQVAVRQ